MKKYSLPLEKLGIGFMPYLSLIVPVYNRPQEVQELLESLDVYKRQPEYYSFCFAIGYEEMGKFIYNFSLSR